ncbi:hypothetical protein [Methylobacterium fujisawaense]|uniref:hypothetical protein n=1 Tax=Methylobacterium fujisawaense TaxID=107400 RepID=UPI0036FC0D77
MCLLCAEGLAGPDAARRAHVLHLLELVEHPDALPADAALRLAQEILSLTQAEPSGFRCDAVPPDAERSDQHERG